MSLQSFPIRLTPGQDLRTALEAQCQNCRAAFVLSGIGSLSTAGLRFAGADQPERLAGDLEILSPWRLMAPRAVRTCTLP